MLSYWVYGLIHLFSACALGWIYNVMFDSDKMLKLCIKLSYVMFTVVSIVVLVRVLYIY